MFPAITERLDRLAIRTGCRSLRGAEAVARSDEAAEHPDYFAEPPGKVTLDFEGKGRFRFPSPLPCTAKENNTVFGRLFTASSRKDGRRPAVVLLHGWNGEQGYKWLFPPLAWRFTRAGLSTAMIELPYHGSRKPKRGPCRNFLSGDILHMMEATRQAISDVRALVAWLKAEGHGPVGLWGVSLGAWLGGLVACCEDELSAAVLVTPIPKIDQAIENLEFCRHIRASLQGREIGPSRLNLTEHRPKLPPQNILLVQSVYDLFAPAAAVEELWSVWGKPDMWRVKHGHISVLFSLPVMNRTGSWLRDRLLPSEKTSP